MAAVIILDGHRLGDVHQAYRDLDRQRSPTHGAPGLRLRRATPGLAGRSCRDSQPSDESKPDGEGRRPNSFPAHADLARLAPEIVLTIFGILAMLLAPFADAPRKDGRRSGGWVVGISVFGAVLAILSTLYPARDPGDAFSGLLLVDDFSLFVHWIVLGVALLVLLGSANYLSREDLPPGEFCALVLFAAVGMCVMASAEELVTVFIGLEISSDFQLHPRQLSPRFPDGR